MTRFSTSYSPAWRADLQPNNHCLPSALAKHILSLMVLHYVDAAW